MGARVAQWVRSLDVTTHTSLSPIRRGFVPSFVNYKKGCTRLAAASDKVYQWWFSPASSTTETAWSPWYSWNIAENGVKHQSSNSNSNSILCESKRHQRYKKKQKKKTQKKQQQNKNIEHEVKCSNLASCYRFSCYYRFSEIAINSVNLSFIWWLEFSKNG